VEVVDLTTGQRVRRLQDVIEVGADVGFFQGAKVTPDGRFVLAVGHLYGDVDDGGFVNQCLVVWSLTSGLVSRVLQIPTPGHGKPFIEDWPTAVSSDGRYVALTTVEEEFRLVDLHNDFAMKTFGSHEGWIGGVVILVRSGLVVTAGGNDETIRAWSMADGTMVWEWPKQGRVTALAASPSERFLAVGTDANGLRLIALAEGTMVASFLLDAPVTALDAHPTLPLLAAGDRIGGVHVFEIENCLAWLNGA